MRDWRRGESARALLEEKGRRAGSSDRDMRRAERGDGGRVIGILKSGGHMFR
jgi:hypothetical protein